MLEHQFVPTAEDQRCLPSYYFQIKSDT